MLRFALAAVALILSTFVSPAIAGELRREVLHSAALGRDLPFLVYVPDGYDSDTKNYTVLYLLHGAGDDENAWASHGLILEKADQLIEKGVIPPTLIVMPGCPNCWWIDGPEDKAETAFWDELVPTVAQRYRTIKSREGRLIAGLSAGGYGTIRFVLRHPDEIAAAAAFSPAIYSEMPPLASASRLNPAFQDKNKQFDISAWNAFNYPSYLDKYFAQPTRVPLFLAAGDNDAMGTAYETALLFKRMIAHQPIKVELRIVSGGHNWAVWASVIDEAMRYMYRFAAKPMSPASEVAGAVPGASLRWPPERLTIATAQPGGLSATYGEALAKLLTRTLKIPVVARQTEGPATNVRLLETGEVQLGIVTLGVAQQAWNGVADWTGGKELRTLRALFPMYDSPFHFVVRKDSGLVSLTDLADKKVGIGPIGGSAGTYAPQIFKALKIDADLINAPNLDLTERLAAGTIDAFVIAGGVPLPAITELNNKAELRFIEPSQSETLTLKLAMPELGASVISANTYRSLERNYQTLGIYNFVMTNKNVPDSFAYAVLEAVFGNLDEVRTFVPPATETLPTNFTRNTVIPFHDGAARWYTSPRPVVVSRARED